MAVEFRLIRGASVPDSSESPSSTVNRMSAFDDIYRRHLDAVFRFAWRLVGRRDVAEDIAAEAFLALHEHMSAIDVSQLPGWLFTVARRRAMDYWRRRAVEERYVNQLTVDSTELPSVATSELLESKALKPVHRLCLRLRYGYGMTLAEIARATGLSETQAKGHLQYGRQILRKSLVKEGR